MKTSLRALVLWSLGLVAAVVAAFAAAAPVVTTGPIVPWRVQVDLAIASNGTVTEARPHVFYRRTLTVDGVALVQDYGSAQWDSVAKKDETIAIVLSNGTTATTTRGAVLAAVLAIAEAERAAQNP